MSQFESEIKSVMENYKMPMDNGAWNDLDKKLNPNKKSSFFGQFVIAGVVLTTAVAVLNDTSDHNAVATHHEEHSSGHEMIAQSNDNQPNSADTYVLTDLSNEETSGHTALDSHINLEASSNSSNELTSLKAKRNENLSTLEKESLLEINKTIKEKSDKTPITEYVGKDFNLNANMLLTPNGDGLHDYFLPEAISKGDDFLMKIFDARNKMIFSTTDIKNPWKGYNQITDAQTEPGKYRWKVILESENRKEIFNGSIRVE